MQYLYVFRGKVKRGAKRGKSLGFPTANIALHKQIPEGLYISQVKVKNVKPGTVWYSAATFIGGAKTFGEKDYKAESYLLDFDKNLYGKWITVKLIKKIHGNIKFSGEKELIEQMKKDEEEVRKYFNS